jgi:hypothetical protein
MKKLLLELLTPWEEPVNSARSICPADLLLLTRLIESRGIKNVVEFGCGVTTKEMRLKGTNLITYSLDLSNPAKQQGPIDFINRDLSDPKSINEIKESLSLAELLVIDADHSFEFAKFYVENYFGDFDGLIWIHDYFSAPLCGEQDYLDKFVIGKTHKIHVMSDLPDNELREISESIGYNLLYWQRKRARKTRASLCAVVLEKI